MISKVVIKRYGLDTKSLKAVFTDEKPARGVANLVHLIQDRIKEGRLRNFQDYRTWAAVDMAYDTPFAQSTPTLLRTIMDNCNDATEVLAALRGWGLSEHTLFSESSTEDGKKKYDLNVPVFTNVLVPLVRAYLTIRVSKIFNDRNLTPLFEYPPAKYTAADRLLCSIITELVETISTNFGYTSTLRSFIWNALMYSVALKFPVEPWTVIEGEDDDGNDVVEKQGIRYVVPHVTRTFYDLQFPIETLNTGTGCAFAGYWTVVRWGDVYLDKRFWNRDNVPHGTNWLDPASAWHTYFTEVYPCAMDFPRPKAGRVTDRETLSHRYTRNDFDSAFFLTYIFMEITPSDWGISDYDKKVWMRFTVGSDNVIMYAEVFPYRPVDYIGYDADSNRSRNSSLAHEIIPFQDITGNILSQFILSVKRNLTNIVFYNTDAVDRTQIDDLNRKSNAQYAELNFVGFDGLKMERAGVDMGNVFKSVTFPFADTNIILSALNTTIQTLERILVVSAQEIGAQATHQQSKKEVEITSGSSSNRIAYTGSFVDEGIDAWKRQLVEAALTNMSGHEVVAMVPMDIPDLQDNLTLIGFEFADKNPIPDLNGRVAIKGKINKLRLTQIVSRRSDADRETNQQSAQAMLQAITAVANSPVLSQAIKPAGLVNSIQEAAKLGGADDDFKLELSQPGVQSNELKQNIQQITQQVLQQVEKQVSQPAAQALAQESQKIDAQGQQIQELVSLVEKISQAVGISQPPASPAASTQPPSQPGPPPQPNAPPIQQPIGG